MRYFDKYFNADNANGYFRTDQHGRKLFFPWGIFGRGYVIASEQDYQRLRRELRVYVGISGIYMVVAFTQVSIMLGIVMHVPIGSTIDYQYFQTYLTVFAVVALPMLVVGLVHYIALVKLSLLHGLQPLPSTARVHHTRSTLWFLAIGSLAFVAVGMVMLATDHGNWLIALGLIVFFGFSAVYFTRLLVLRRLAVRPD